MTNYTLLLIDYEPRSIERVRRSLEQAGIRVELATDGVAGLEAFERLLPDAVIVEAMLPKRHGFEVCQEIKRSAHGKRTPVIVTTGVYKGRRYRTQAMHIHGADEYLEKPFTEEQIVSIVQRFLADRPERSEGESAQLPASAPAAPPPQPQRSVVAHEAPPPQIDTLDDGSDIFEIVDESLSLPTRAARTAAPLPPAAPPVKAPPPPKASPFSSAVGDLTEDEIVARLDALLPSDPSMSTEVSWESGQAIGHLDTVTEPQSGRSMAVAVEVEQPPEVPTETPFEIPPEFDPSPEVETLPDEIVPDVRFVDVAPPVTREVLSTSPPAPPVEPPRATAHVVPFDAGRSSKKKQRSSSGNAPNADALYGRSAGSAAVVPEVAVAMAPAVAEMPAVEIPLTEAESYETARTGLPFWVWALAVAGLAAGAYFAFFREPQPAPATVAAAVTPQPSTAPAVESALPAADSAALPPAIPATLPRESVPPPTTTKSTATAVAAKPQQPLPTVSETAKAPPVQPPTVAAPQPQAPEPARAEPAGESLEDPSLAATPIAAAIPMPSPPKAAVQPGDLLSLNEVDSPPLGIERPAPQYTQLGRTRRQEGTVLLEVLVDETGHVADVRVLRGIAGSDLNEAAMNAVRSWVYKPGVKDGVPVRVWRPEQIRFKL